MREGGVALVSVTLEFNPLKLGAADDEDFEVRKRGSKCVFRFIP